MRYRYGRWTGTQDPLGGDLSAERVLEELSEDLLAGVDPAEALQRMQRRGMTGGMAGLDDLRRRVERARQRELGRMGLDGPLRQVAERIEEVVELERTAIDLAESEEAAQRGAHLDSLPDDVAGRLSHLEEHDWEDAGAEADFRELVASLRRDVAEATFGRLARSLGALRPEDLRRTRDMLAELNAMVAKRDRGEDVTEDFAAFRERYADLVADAETLDELLEELARRMAALQALLSGLDQDQRAQLAAMTDQLLGDDMDLAFEVSELGHALRRAFPDLGWDEGVPGAGPVGEEDGSLTRTVDWVERLQGMHDLETALGQRYPGAHLEDVDAEALRRLVGDEAAEDLARLREVERVLEEAGAAHRRHGRLELTPRGIRLLGERALARIFGRTVAGPLGGHRTQTSGGDGEPTGSSRPLRFGDDFRIDVGRTVSNAVLRRAGHGKGAGRGVRLDAEDFSLAEAERRVRTVTVLLLDMSFSMPLRGNWVPAKRVALALEALVASRYPEDRLFVVGFSDYARRLRPQDLMSSGWERVYGTNMQHAFQVTRRLLTAYPGSERQVVMITDGEPTAHLEGGQAYFSWPPEPRTLERTLAEAHRLARTGAVLNVFLLDHDPGAAAFTERMVSVVGGRIFYPDLDDLGSMVVKDFLRRRG
jgi:uncharacterized protein with von Willebrand factor type A (vWA) domain